MWGTTNPDSEYVSYSGTYWLPEYEQDQVCENRHKHKRSRTRWRMSSIKDSQKFDNMNTRYWRFLLPIEANQMGRSPKAPSSVVSIRGNCLMLDLPLSNIIALHFHKWLTKLQSLITIITERIFLIRPIGHKQLGHWIRSWKWVKVRLWAVSNRNPY